MGRPQARTARGPAPLRAARRGMWALRAAVRPGARVSRSGGCVPRVVRCRGAPRVAHLPPPWPERALAAFGPGDPRGLQHRGGGGRGPRADGRGGRAGEEEEEDEEPEGAEQEEEDVEELLSRAPLLPAGTQRVCLVHPEVKWGPGKPLQPQAEWQVAEAKALVHTLDNWSVVETVVVPTKTPDKKLIFSKGVLEHLTDKIRGLAEITAVFLNVEKMSGPTKKELEAAWGVQVFDRFTVVLHIFRCNARTREARLQVALAELPVLRAKLKNGAGRLDGRGGSRYIMGSGESFMQVQQRLLKEKEMKIRKALERLRRKRQLLGTQRRRRELPVVSVVGYTNSGKTTLVKALTGDAAVQPRDQLFATLDVTAHAGSLPSRMTVIYLDTIGFLSQLPHGLVESFSATLEDVAHSDVILHVRDASHPESELQRATVLAALRGLRLPAPLLAGVLEVHNKADLLPGYRPPGPGALAVSALRGLGLQELRAELDAAVLRATDRRVRTLRVRLAGAQLSWLHREATVQDVHVVPEAGVADVTVIISNAAYGKFRKLFPE